MFKYKTISGPVAVAGLALMVALGACSSGGDAPATDTTDMTPEPHVCEAGPSQACVDARQAELDALGGDATVAQVNAATKARDAAQMALDDAKAAAARQALVDAAMCMAATQACVDAHQVLVDALQADLEALQASDDATNAQEQAAQKAVDDAQMALDEVKMELAGVNRDTATGIAVTAAEDAAGMLEDDRSAEAIMAAKEAIMAAKEAIAAGDDPDAFSDEIASAEMAVARAEERNVVDDVVMAAEAAADGLKTDPGVDAVTAAQEKIDAAKAAIEEAEHLTDDEKTIETAKVAAAQGTVTVAKNANDKAARMAELEKQRKAEEKAKEMAAAGKALHRALTMNPLAFLTATNADTINGAGLMVAAAADVLDGDNTVDDVPLPRMKAGASAGMLGGWKGMNYADMDRGTKVTNLAVVYTNQGAPTSVPFDAAVTTDIYTAANRSLAFSTSHTADPRIKASMFPTSGTKTYSPNAPGGDEVSFPGTYNGASGTYVCDTGGTAGGCGATFNSAGISLTSGTWTFVHPKGAMTSEPDRNYLYFGWWLRKDKDGMPTHASAFHGMEGTVTAPTVNLDTIDGSATYVGKAAGKFALSNLLDGTGDAGHFTADATLEAKFGSGASAGITGMIDNFMANDKSVPWSVSLHRAGWGAAGAITAPADNAATAAVDEGRATTWSIDGNSASASGTWSGQTYDEAATGAADDGSNVPTTVIGTFQSEFGSIGRMVGGFGATKQ